MLRFQDGVKKHRFGMMTQLETSKGLYSTTVYFSVSYCCFLSTWCFRDTIRFLMSKLLFSATSVKRYFYFFKL